jgi:hypothetical protein
MIIFFDKKTGEIVGTIGGRINLPEEFNMWLGETKDEYGRLSVQWKPKKNGDFEPDHEQKDIFIKLDENPSDIYEYKVDLKNKNLVAK